MTSDPAQRKTKTGVLLVNLGTPDAPVPSAVRRYLRQFLSDPRVLDVNPVLRWLLLNLVILPFRPKQSAEAYEKIWTMRGSPLIIHGEALSSKVQIALGNEYEVVLAMRYGNPSIERGFERLRTRGIDRIVVVPLYPQNASSSTGSTVEEVCRVASKYWKVPSLSFVPPFFDDPGFLDAACGIARPLLEPFAPDHVLFSFHGLPERHIRKGDDSGRHCLASESCCDELQTINRNCYRAQCFETARQLASRLELPEELWSVTFQSRLGRDPWIRPYTDERVTALAAAGVKRLAVLCPAFVADCLETIEEIGLRAREDFLVAGGEDLRLIPSVNASDDWASTVARLVQRAAGAPGGVT